MTVPFDSVRVNVAVRDVGSSQMFRDHVLPTLIHPDNRVMAAAVRFLQTLPSNGAKVPIPDVLRTHVVTLVRLSWLYVPGRAYGLFILSDVDGVRTCPVCGEPMDKALVRCASCAGSLMMTTLEAFQPPTG